MDAAVIGSATRRDLGLGVKLGRVHGRVQIYLTPVRVPGLFQLFGWEIMATQEKNVFQVDFSYIANQQPPNFSACVQNPRYCPTVTGWDLGAGRHPSCVRFVPDTVPKSQWQLLGEKMRQRAIQVVFQDPVNMCGIILGNSLGGHPLGEGFMSTDHFEVGATRLFTY